MSTSYSIRWFRENTTGAVKDLVLGDPFFQQGNDRTSRYHDTAFTNQPYSPSLLGKYWCQVINTTADPCQPLMRSNVFTLLAPGDYSGPACSGVQTVENIACADLPVHGQISGSATIITSLIDITSHSTIIPTISLAHMPSVVTTPTQISAAQQNPFVVVIAVVGVVIVIISVVAVTAIVILFIKWRQSTNSNKG